MSTDIPLRTSFAEDMPPIEPNEYEEKPDDKPNPAAVVVYVLGSLCAILSVIAMALKKKKKRK